MNNTYLLKVTVALVISLALVGNVSAEETENTDTAAVAENSDISDLEDFAGRATNASLPEAINTRPATAPLHEHAPLTPGEHALETDSNAAINAVLPSSAVK